MLSNSFCEASVTLTPKPHKNITRKLQTSIPYKYKYKSHQQNTNKLNPAAYQVIIHHNQVGFVPGMQGWLNIKNQLIE